MNKTRTMVVVVALALAALSGCAVTPLATQSGRPEAYIEAAPAKVKDVLLTVMSSNGYAPIGVTDNALAFTKKMDSGQAAAIMLVSAIGDGLTGGHGGTLLGEPDINVRFTLIPWGTGGTHVYAFTNATAQTAWGQTQTFDTSQGKMGQETQQLLEQLAAQAAAGRKRN